MQALDARLLLAEGKASALVPRFEELMHAQFGAEDLQQSDQARSGGAIGLCYQLAQWTGNTHG